MGLLGVENDDQNAGDQSSHLQMIYKTSSGDEIYRNEDSLVVKFPGKRNAITTSYLHGGYQEHLTAVYNHEPKPTKGHCAHNLEGGSIEAYSAIHSQRLGLDPDSTACMMTAAKMKNAAIATRSFRNLEVTAIVTAGIEVNGGRAGDPASWHEEEGQTIYVGGTINTIILVNCRLPPHTLARVIMTATEAKTVAIQQLMAPSRYSTGIATGSGTDQICVISNLESPHVITWAGKHSKLGELVARCVIEATTQALAKQTNLTPETQRDMLVRLERFGIDEKKYWDVATSFEGENKKDYFIRNLRNLSKNPAVVAMVTAILHIIDEIDWGLIPEMAGKKAAFSMMEAFPQVAGLQSPPHYCSVVDERLSILENWIRLTAWCVKNGFLGKKS